MKKHILTIIISITATSIFMTGCGTGSESNHSESAAHEHMRDSDEAVAENAYICPMHPEETGKKGDSCSKCGMDLESADDQAENKMDDQMASCPMHPEETGKSGDKCGKCGMDLEKPAEKESE